MGKLRRMFAALTPTQLVACAVLLPITTVGTLLLAWCFIYYNKRRALRNG